MKNSIYYSDQEEPQHKIQKKQVSKQVPSKAQASCFSSAPLQNQFTLIKEYGKKISKLSNLVPLKNVVYVNPSKYDQLPTDDDSYRYQGGNNKARIKQQGPIGVFTRSKNRYLDEKELALLSNMKIPQVTQEIAPKTKFRCLSFNRMRRANGPHQPLFFVQNQKAESQEENQVKLERSLYFSDASGDAENPHQQQTEKQQSYCKLQENLIPEVEKNNGKYIVNRHNLSKLYEYISIQLQLAKYSAQPNQDPFWEKIFNQAVADLSYKASTERSSHLLSKGRHFIVRKIMQVYAEIPPKPRPEDRFVRNRLTIKQRNMMTKAFLPIPPPRLTAEFLGTLFQNNKFRIFFKDFIYKGHLQQALMNRSNSQIMKYDSYCKKIASQKLDVQQKILMLKGDPTPLSWLEVRLFMQEAYAISDKYCNDL